LNTGANGLVQSVDMKEYDLSDRKLKIVVVMAMVIIGWFCAKRAMASHPQTARVSTRVTSAAPSAAGDLAQ
jgi:hypothetical protein